jgi:hypothetical protein
MRGVGTMVVEGSTRLLSEALAIAAIWKVKFQATLNPIGPPAGETN